MIKKIAIVFLIIVVVIFLVNCSIVKLKKLNADPITATAIIACAAVLVVAGFVFYEWDDLTAAAQSMYAMGSDELRVAVDALVISNDTELTVSAGMLDSIYWIYDEYIKNNETVQNALYGIRGAIVNNFSFVKDEFGNYMFVNVVPGGGYYTNVNQFPEYDDLIHKKGDVLNTVTNFKAVMSFQYAIESNIWCWNFDYNGVKKYYTSNETSAVKSAFLEGTQRLINGVTYSLKTGTSVYTWTNTSNMSIAVMAINNTAKPYLVRKNTGGVTTYLELWTPISSDSDYVIDEPTNDRINSGVAWLIDIQYGTSSGIYDRTKTGNDVLGGVDSKVIDVPIDTPTDMLGTTSAGALAGEWAGETDYTHTNEAVNEATTTWAEYTGEMQEMDIPQIIMSKFPFCIPFDLAGAIGNLVSSPEAPKFEFVLNAGMIQGVSFDVDFSKFNFLAIIIRWGVLILFNIALIKLTRNIIRG